MKVYGALEAAQIEWFTNAGKPAASSYPFRVIYVTDLKQIQVSDGTNWNPSALYTYTAGTLPAAGASNQYQVAFITDTLQVKVSNGTEWKTIGARLDTYTSGTIPAAASNTNSIIWVSDLQQVQVSNGSAWVQVGSKAGTKNYFSQNNANPDFETNSVSPWSACTLTFSSGVPSGAPTLTATQMSIATTATTPLSGTYSMLLTKAAANAQYQGFISGALTIDREDTAKVLYGSFYYEVVSGTIDLSGSSTQSLEIWIYNTVSGQWTQPAGYRGMNQSNGVGKVVFSFQTDGTFANNAYKIAVITQQTGTGAIVVKFDDFLLGPQAIVLGAAMTDWVSYTPTLIGANGVAYTNQTTTGQWRRVGDSIELLINSSFTGTPAGGTSYFRWTLPTGLSADTTKVSSVSGAVGVARAFQSAYYTGTVFYEGATTVAIAGDTASGNFWGASSPAAFANNHTLSFTARIPVVGFSSNVQTSSDTDTRVVAAAIKGLATTSLTTGNPYTFNTVEFDTHGAYNTSTYKYIVPVSGIYRATVSGAYSASPGDIILTKNSTVVIYMGTTSGARLTCSAIVQAVAGDELWIQSGMTITTATGAQNGIRVQYERLSGPSVVTATETVAARYTNASGQSIPNNSTVAITGWTKDFDTHQMFNTSSGIVTIPISGKYTFSNMTTYNSGSITLPSEFSIDIQQAGSVSRSIKLGAIFAQSSNSYFVSVVGSTAIHCNAGDTVTIVAFQSSGAARTLAGGASFNHLSITRVGN